MSSPAIILAIIIPLILTVAILTWGATMVLLTLRGRGRGRASTREYILRTKNIPVILTFWPYRVYYRIRHGRAHPPNDIEARVGGLQPEEVNVGGQSKVTMNSTPPGPKDSLDLTQYSRGPMPVYGTNDNNENFVIGDGEEEEAEDGKPLSKIPPIPASGASGNGYLQPQSKSQARPARQPPRYDKNGRRLPPLPSERLKKVMRGEITE